LSAVVRTAPACAGPKAPVAAGPVAGRRTSLGSPYGQVTGQEATQAASRPGEPVGGAQPQHARALPVRQRRLFEYRTGAHSPPPPPEMRTPRPRRPPQRASRSGAERCRKGRRVEARSSPRPGSGLLHQGAERGP
jgi:hypothetical protein